MKIFLSGFESQDIDKWLEIDPDLHLKWVLMSYAHIRGQKPSRINEIISKADNVLVDSGAHTLQKGKAVEWEEYTHEFGQWIAEHDEPKIIGYFEMDVDNMIGLNRVEELRQIMYGYTDKVIPVWHRSRGNEYFEKMCEEAGQHSGIVSFSGVADTLTTGEMLWMTKTAWKHNCKIHALGVTVKGILNSVPFDYVDSSSWLQGTIYGHVDKRDIRKVKQTDSIIARMSAHELWQRKQEYYFDKWKGVSPMGDEG